MDDLVCIPLLNIGWAYQVSWWALMTLAFICLAFILLSVKWKYQGIWYFIFTLGLYAGGFLDFLYILAKPFPAFWLDLDYIWFWNPFYQFLGVPWNIVYQSIWWIIWSIILVCTYLYMRDWYGIYGIVKGE